MTAIHVNHDPRTRETTPTGILFEKYFRYGMEPALQGATRGHQCDIFDEFEVRLMEAGQFGKLKFFSDKQEDNINLDELFDRTMSHKGMLPVRWAFNEMARRGSSAFEDRRLMEDVMDAMDNSLFDRFLSDLTRIGAWELCTGPGVDSILALVPQVRVPCGTDKLRTPPALPQIDLDEFAPDEETPYFGLEPPIEMTLPERVKLKLAFAYKRELCTQFRQEVETQMRRGSQILDEGAARAILKMIFYLYEAGENRWQFTMDGFSFEPYYAVGSSPAGDPFPWENQLFNNDTDWEDLCNWGPFEVIEDVFQNLYDPRDNRPMTCCPEAMLIVPHREVARRLDFLLNAGNITKGWELGDACSTRIAVNDTNPSRDLGFSGRVETSRWMIEILKTQLAVLNPLWTADQILQAIKRTFYAGCPDKSFAWQVEWERETLTRSGNQTWEYWNQEIIWSTKFMEKVGGAYTSPWHSVLYTGLPDGVLPT